MTGHEWREVPHSFSWRRVRHAPPPAPAIEEPVADYRCARCGARLMDKPADPYRHQVAALVRALPQGECPFAGNAGAVASVEAILARTPRMADPIRARRAVPAQVDLFAP